MYGKPSQAANVSTLLEAKNRSSFVTSAGSNNRMQRSAASKFLIIASILHAAPADHGVRPSPSKQGKPMFVMPSQTANASTLLDVKRAG